MEVYSWINFLIENGCGPPTFFMTLSCTEHNWQDIERLIKQCMKMAGTDPKNHDQNPISFVHCCEGMLSEKSFSLVGDSWKEDFSHKRHKFRFGPQKYLYNFVFKGS